MRLRAKLLMPIGMALLGTLGVHLWSTQARHAAAEEQVRVERQAREQVRAALAVEVALKKQVQEWKNLLLRGHVVEDYGRYHRQFLEREQQVRDGLARLAASSDGALRGPILTLQQEHRALSVAYRRALEPLQTVGGLQGIRAADQAARGRDRPVTRSMEELVDQVEALAAARSRQAATQARTTDRWLLIASVSIYVLIGLVLLLLIGRFVSRPAERAARMARDLARGEALPPSEDLDEDEFGDLVASLRDLHAALVQERQRNASTQATLAETEAQMRKASTARDTFLANITHELRTPLHGVLGTLELLVDSELSTDQRELADAAIVSAHRLADLVADLLDLTQASDGRLHLEQQRLDLTAELLTVVDEARPRAAAKGLALLAEPPPEPLRAIGDGARIRQILGELLDNAIEHTPAGHIEIAFSARPEADGRLRLRVEVSDTGPGVPAHLAEELFEPFTQIDGSRTRAHEGAGLGLAVCREVVRHMQGELGVRPRTGGGSCFWFELSLEGAEASLVDDAGDTPLPVSTAPEHLALFCEPHPLGRKVVDRILGELAVPARMVEQPRAAAAALELDGYEVAVIALDGVGGSTEALATLRAAIDRGGHLTALVAMAPAAHHEALLDAGWDDVLDVPPDRPAVRGLLARWLDAAVLSRAS